MARVDMMDPDLISEETGQPRRSVVDAMAAGRLPALWLGPRRPRCPRPVFDLFMRGEPIEQRYLAGKAAQLGMGKGSDEDWV